jgi:dihydroflavonol-4-reductase
VPRIEAPNWVARLAALGHSLAAGSDLAARQGQAYHERQGEELAWLVPRGDEEVIVSTAESLIRLGMVKP